MGRFGRKASVSSLDAFNAGAFFNEMGITNRLNPAEGTVAGRPLPKGVDQARDPELSFASLAATTSASISTLFAYCTPPCTTL